jgi:hypothetical protein
MDGKNLVMSKMAENQFVVLSRYRSKGPFHLKDSNFNCADSRLFIKFNQRGRAEILVDLGKTYYSNDLWVAYYIFGTWNYSVPFNEMGLCKKCSKKLLEYIQESLKDYSEEELDKLFLSNRKIIREALTSWSKGEIGN